MVPATAAGRRLFRFGVCSDIQYADIPDGQSFIGVSRYYRAALESTRRIVKGWQSAGVDFAVQYGDIIDGYARENSVAAVESVMQEFDHLGVPLYHLIGNHCLYNLPRSYLTTRLGIQSVVPGCSYYSFSPHPGWRMIMIDSYDISALGWDSGHPHRQLADDFLNARNPNTEKNSPEGLTGVAQRCVKFNGGVGPQQLSWLLGQCQAASHANEKVLIGSHIPIHPDCAPHITLIWNYDEVLDVLHSTDCVVAVFSGHVHDDFYFCDHKGIHHRVLKGVIETAPGQDCFGVVDVLDDAVVIHGAGIESATFKVPQRAQQQDSEQAFPAGRQQPSFGAAARDVMSMLPGMKLS